jgi:hypothetical protein
MLKNRSLCLLLGLLFSTAVPAASQVSVGVGTSHVSIGISVSSYPDLVVVPGYPVYYAPRLQANLFFYDGLYWIYDNDDWYASAWYNGPWDYVSAVQVPLYILRVPVRYYRLPPVYFHGWRQDSPPQWGRHWGRDWEQRRSGWDRWDRRANLQPAPPPVYQQHYSGERYPRQLEQQELRQKNYRYQSRDPVVRQHDEARGGGNADENRNERSLPDSRSEREGVDVRADPGSPRANGGRQWDMPRDSQSADRPQLEGSGDRRSGPMQQGDAGIERRNSSPPERANGRADRQPRATESRQHSQAEERQPRQQGRDGGRESRPEQDGARGRGRNEQ